MSVPPPDPLDYASHDVRPVKSRGDQVLIGLAIGAGVSLIAWGLGWETVLASDSTFWTALSIVGAIKVVGGCATLFLRRWRWIGAGLLISLALGPLIFFGSCFAHIK